MTFLFLKKISVARDLFHKVFQNQLTSLIFPMTCWFSVLIISALLLFLLLSWSSNAVFFFFYVSTFFFFNISTKLYMHHMYVDMQFFIIV